MEFIALIVRIIISVTLPVWMYLWFSKKVNKRSSADINLTGTSYLRFLLKRWWAEWCLGGKKRTGITNFNNYNELHEGNSRIVSNEDSCSSILFYAADQKGNSLYVKFVYRRCRMAEVSLKLITSDGRLFVLPGYPNTVVIRDTNQEWSAAGLRIELLEFQKRWRITYNGMLRDLSQFDDGNVEHVRLNFIFITQPDLLKWPHDWSTKLHAEALASEPWKGPKWMNKINLLDFSGFDQWGSTIGQITFKDSRVSALYLRGLSQRRWGKHESDQFHKTVTLFGVTSIGHMFYLGASSTKHSFSQMRFGHHRSANEIIRKVDWTNLKLNDFTDQKCATDTERTISFAADKIECNVSVKFEKPIVLHSGQPWNWTSTIINVKLEMNGTTGFGLMEVMHPYNGPRQTETDVKFQHFKQPSTSVQRDNYVVSFKDGKCQHENIVGGKGFSLAALTSIKNADFTIPEGFCVTVFALELQLQTHKELREVIDDIEDICFKKKDGDLKRQCEEAVRIIQSTPIVEPVKDAICKGIENLEASCAENNGEICRYAVRSSAVGEDSEETSAAGQNSTYLGITGVDDITKCIAMCWASLFSYQSIEYRKQHGLFVKASMGVCVQKMVNAEAAGVMFTRHPTTGDPSDIMITSNYGLGETVVSAVVEPDVITVHRSWDNKLNVKSLTLGNKTQKMSVSGDGIATIILNEEEIEKVSISEKIALRLATIGLQVEGVLGSGRDIEWAVVNDEIFLLQARPITTIYAWTDFELTHELDTGVPNDSDLMTTANVGEVLPNPLSPLSISTIQKILNSCALNGKHYDILHVTAMRCTLNYFNTFMRNVGKDLSNFNKAVDIAICGSVVVNPEIHKVAFERNGQTTGRNVIYEMYRILYNSWYSGAMVKDCKYLCRKLVLNEDDYHTAYSLYNQIDRKLKEIDKINYYHIAVTGVSSTSEVMALQLLTKGYEDFLPDHLSDIAILLSSCNDVLSAEIPAMIGEIARSIRKSGKADTFQKIKPSDGITWLKVHCSSAAEQLELLLKKHGHRCVQEMDLLSEPWSLKPENLIATIQTLVMSTENKSPSKKLSVEETVACFKTPKSWTTKWLLKKMIPFCRRAIMNREITKATLVKAVHKFKIAYRRLGALMVSEGYLPDENLVFFLTHSEIGQLLINRRPTLVQKAHRRKKLHPRLAELEYPEFMTGMPMPIESNLNTTIRDDCIKIQGTSVCTGSVLGRACVITKLSKANEIQDGDILITHSTDIGWSPYFPLVGGIVTELGGLISHGAVVAREYGLPCIVGAKGATQIFRTGDTVLLVADAGVLQLVGKN